MDVVLLNAPLSPEAVKYALAEFEGEVERTRVILVVAPDLEFGAKLMVGVDGPFEGFQLEIATGLLPGAWELRYL